MPTVVLNKEVFEKLVGKKLPLDILKDRISMLGTDLEKIEGNEIHVEVFPNRPDMLSEQGFARALSSFIGVKTGLKEYKIKKSGYKVLIDSSVTMRPYTMCAIVKNLTFTDEKIREIMQIQEKLATTHGRNRKKSAYGIYPADKINFPIKYTAKNPEEVLFKPLGFTKQIKASQVAEEHPKGIAYKHLTEGWKEYPFFIDAKLQIMCMLPFTNSEETGKMKLKLEYVNKRLGLNLKEGDGKKLLERMGYDYDKGIVSIPAYRADILHMIDIVEDIAIAYGYENFSEEIPNVSTIAHEDEFKIFERRISNILCGLGLIETCNYHLINYDEQTKKMNLNEKAMDSVNVKLANPTTAEYNALRSWMIPCLMNVFKSNKHNEYPQKIFDTGIVFRKNKNTETNVEEITTLAVGSSHATTDFTEIKQILDYLLNMLNIEYKIIEHEHPFFITGRIGEIIIRDKKMGVIGEISPQVLENFGLETPVSEFELDLNELFNVMRH